MSRALAQYLVSGDITAALPELTMADVPDFNVQICLREVYMQFTNKLTVLNHFYLNGSVLD